MRLLCQRACADEGGKPLADELRHVRHAGEQGIHEHEADALLARDGDARHHHDDGEQGEAEAAHEQDEHAIALGDEGEQQKRGDEHGKQHHVRLRDGGGAGERQPHDGEDGGRQQVCREHDDAVVEEGKLAGEGHRPQHGRHDANHDDAQKRLPELPAHVAVGGGRLERVELGGVVAAETQRHEQQHEVAEHEHRHGEQQPRLPEREEQPERQQRQHRSQDDLLLRLAQHTERQHLLPTDEAAGGAQAHEHARRAEHGKRPGEEVAQQKDHAGRHEQHRFHERRAVEQVREARRAQEVAEERHDVAHVQRGAPIRLRVLAEHRLRQKREAPQGKRVHGQEGCKSYPDQKQLSFSGMRHIPSRALIVGEISVRCPFATAKS